MFLLKQSTASQEVPVLLVDLIDGYSPETTITSPTITIAKTTGAFASANDGTWAEDASGWYTVQLDATDTATLGVLKLHVEKTGCRSFDDYGYVLPANVYDSLFSTDKLQVDVTQVEGSDATDQLKSVADTALSDQNLDHLMKTGDATLTNIVADSTALAHLMAIGADISDFDGSTDSLEALSDRAVTAGGGSETYTYAVTDSDTALPIEGVNVWISTDQAGSNVIAGTLTTNASGEAVFYLDDGSYYLWRQKSGYDPDTDNPVAITVSVGGSSTADTMTASSAGSGGPGTVYSCNSLVDQLIGELNQDRNASGGSVPNRLLNIVKESLRHVWSKRDWVWMLRRGTLTVTEGTGTADLPGDFREMRSWVLKDEDEDTILKLTANPARWEELRGEYKDTEEGSPEVGCIMQKTSETDKVEFEVILLPPLPNKDRSYRFVYTRLCPIDLAADHDDYKAAGDAIPMPEAFHELWHLHALWRAQRRFGKSELAKETKEDFDGCYEDVVKENNELLTTDPSVTRDGYNDLGALPGGGTGGPSQPRLDLTE